jgi:hypothetical protein
MGNVCRFQVQLAMCKVRRLESFGRNRFQVVVKAKGVFEMLSFGGGLNRQLPLRLGFSC